MWASQHHPPAISASLRAWLVIFGGLTLSAIALLVITAT